jgi:anti-anti-sigma factor
VKSESEERSGHQDLELEAGREGDTHVIRLSGELDLGNHERLDQALLEAEAGDAPRILVDLDRLLFIDSTGLRVILKAARRAEESGGRLRITRGKGYVADMFRLTALDVTLPFED